MIRILRQGYVPTTRERWYLWGLVKLVTHPLPLWQEPPDWFVAATEASPTSPASDDPACDGVVSAA